MAEGKKEKADDGKLKFGYISKMLTHPWFIQESQGIEDKCEELGVEYVAIDANQDNEQFMQAFENLIARGADAILFCITDPQLGPTVADRAEEAGIPIMTIDDNIVDSNGDPVPHVGMPTTEVGYQGGKALAKEAKERGFMEPGNNVKVMSVTVSFKTFLLERTQGYHKALKEELPSIPDENYIMEDNKTGMFEDVLPVASSILNANPDATHWIVTGINDDSAIAPLRVFEENGFPLENVIACGLGGYKLSLEEFQKDHNSYIVNKTQPHEEGVQAAQLMYDHIVNDKELPEVTYVPGVIVTKENYKDFDWSM
jgi:L-arabinose transport system substrate-binding protein